MGVSFILRKRYRGSLELGVWSWELDTQNPRLLTPDS